MTPILTKKPTKTTKKISTTSVVQARVDNDVKKQAELIFAHIGLSSSDAIKIFFKQVVNSSGLPFQLNTYRAPDAQELAAIEDFIANPELATIDEIRETEKLLGIKLKY